WRRTPTRSTLFPYTTLFRSEDRILVEQGAPLGQPVGVRHRPERPGACAVGEEFAEVASEIVGLDRVAVDGQQLARGQLDHVQVGDRKSTRLNSSHVKKSYAV